MKLLHNKIDKKTIADLPRELFEGRIFVIQSEGEADKAVDYLMSFPLLGVDTETRPSFRKGHTNKVALLQVSTDDTCFLFRLNRIGITPSILRLLQDERVCKVGLSLRDDFLSLHERGEFAPCGFVELQDWVKRFGIEDMSLQKLYANLFGKKISKGQRLTNWEADVLTEGQQRYAATDAWACVKLYRELKEMEETGCYEVVKVAEPEPAEVVASRQTD
ncbi:MAG: 3'-5' exonuclease domain-containing protein 2 [Clostridium sp.]|nr:3'-5' exonuclease domain-containing protein 2 [Clostridium sp.]